MLYCRGIEWSLRAFASMRAVRIFLQARAVINFVMRAASTLEITNGEQRGLRNFPPAGTLFLRQVIWLTPSKQDNLLRFYHSQQLTANYALYMPFDAELLHLASRKSDR